MIYTTPENALHKQQLCQLLTEIADDNVVAQNVVFKGGTCAAMLGYLDRFSVDLDFDLRLHNDMSKTTLREKLYTIFEVLSLEIKDESRDQLQFFLRYKSRINERNTLKLEILETHLEMNKTEKVHISDIDRLLCCQTIETMFAHKMVALLDRYEKNGSIAGRDVYDINYFFTQGYQYIPEIITVRRGTSIVLFLQELQKFINQKISQKILDQDLNYLLSYEKFKIARKFLKTEVLSHLENEIQRL